MLMLRRATSSTLCLVAAGPVRRIRTQNAPGTIGSYYQNTEIKKAGVDELVRHTEVYDGYTDDHGVFKEGPPTSLRLEYLRSPEHGFNADVMTKKLWSPFQADTSYNHFTPLFEDSLRFSSRNYFGLRSGTDPGSRTRLGHYQRKVTRYCDHRVAPNFHHIRRVPKWLACICHFPKMKAFVGFYLYANGAYVAELLTFKQLPRIVYNKPFESSVPTLGQTVDLAEVAYGKEIHSIELYPGKGAVACRASGTSAVVLRGSEPGLVPLMLPSKEVRLFETSSLAVFGRRAGVMQSQSRLGSWRTSSKVNYCRPAVHAKSKRVAQHPAGGGNGTSANLVIPLDWRVHPRNCVKTKYWLSGYILRGRQYQKGASTADIKSKTYGWASRDKVYR